MKRTLQFVGSVGTVTCEVDGMRVALPVIPGILKHPTVEQLPAVLCRPGVAVKYTAHAIEKCAWPVLRLFPSAWIRHCIPYARLTPSRKAALLFLL